MHNQDASVASLRRLFAFAATLFGFALEAASTFTGISTNLREQIEAQLSSPK